MNILDLIGRCPRCHEPVCICTGFAKLWPTPRLSGHPPGTDQWSGLVEDLQSVCRERAFIVATLARMAFNVIGNHWPAWVAPHWGPNWLNVVYVHLPTGTVSWHIHKDELPLFDFLPHLTVEEMARDYAAPYQYDGHSTDEKYRRIYEYVTGKKT